MRSVPEPSSVGGSTAGRDPWAGFAAGPSSATPRYPAGVANGSGSGGGGGDADGERAVAEVARRVQDRVDGQEALLERVAELAPRDDRAWLPELRDVARRLRRDSEALLLLCGDDPGVHRGAPHTVPAVLGEAVALVDEPSRVGQRSAPPVTLAATAAVELRHLVAELVDEAAAASPGARIEVGARLDVDGALLVEIAVVDRGWPDATGAGYRGFSRVAERLARRSTGGIRLQRPLLDDGGAVATVYCPPALVTGQAAGDPWHLTSASVAPRQDPPQLDPYPPYPSELSRPELSRPDPVRPEVSRPDPVRPDPSRTDTSSFPVTPFPAPSRSGGDELFGPLPASVGAVGTPIFEAVASAWFRDDERALANDEWDSPGDLEWRAAAARATNTDTPSLGITATGLPRRSPGDRLVPPPRASRQSTPPVDDRVPERVRDRLATYQRGLEQGRHRATEPARPDLSPLDAADEPRAWTAEGW